MDYKTALKTMQAGHPVIKDHAVYFIPATAQPTEENIHFILIEDGIFESDIDSVSKEATDWEPL